MLSSDRKSAETVTILLTMEVNGGLCNRQLSLFGLKAVIELHTNVGYPKTSPRFSRDEVAQKTLVRQSVS
jgi:hypothetical protein